MALGWATKLYKILQTVTRPVGAQNLGVGLSARSPTPVGDPMCDRVSIPFAPASLWHTRPLSRVQGEGFSYTFQVLDRMNYRLGTMNACSSLAGHRRVAGTRDADRSRGRKITSTIQAFSGILACSLGTAASTNRSSLGWCGRLEGVGAEIRHTRRRWRRWTEKPEHPGLG